MVMEHSVTKAAIAPTTAKGGAMIAPASPKVKGSSKRVLPFLSFMVIFLALPFWIIALTLATRLAPLTLTVVAFFVVFFIII